MKTPVSSLSTVSIVAPDEAEAPPAAPVIARESLHVRLPSTTVARVREAAHRLKRERQDITDEALRDWLTRQGF